MGGIGTGALHTQWVSGHRSDNAEILARRLKDSIHAAMAEEEKTHVQVRAGSKVGADQYFPQGRYIIRKQLGRGVYGKVFECEDLKYKHSGELGVVAVKIVRDAPEFQKAALNEIRALRKLGGKCGVVRLCRDFIHFNHICISLDLHGETLTQKLKRVGRLSLEQVADVGLQLLHGINHMHNCGIIHTDMKTDNVLVYHRSTDPSSDSPHYSLVVRIADLGSAAFDTGRKQPIVGTCEYRAPECVLYNGWSYEIDTWGVGCILAELAAGIKVFGEHLTENVHLLLMQRCLGRQIPERMLYQAWSQKSSKWSVHKSKTLVLDETGRKVRINPVAADSLQESKLRGGFVLRKIISDMQLLDVFDKIFEFDPAMRSSPGPLRSHTFFARARFDRSNMDTETECHPTKTPAGNSSQNMEIKPSRTPVIVASTSGHSSAGLAYGFGNLLGFADRQTQSQQPTVSPKNVSPFMQAEDEVTFIEIPDVQGDYTAALGSSHFTSRNSSHYTHQNFSAASYSSQPPDPNITPPTSSDSRPKAYVANARLSPLEGANALKEMHAQCDALESDFAALFTDKHSRQTQHKSQLADIRDDLASEQHRLQEMRGENDQWKQALDALQAKINKVIALEDIGPGEHSRRNTPQTSPQAEGLGVKAAETGSSWFQQALFQLPSITYNSPQHAERDANDHARTVTNSATEPAPPPRTQRYFSYADTMKPSNLGNGCEPVEISSPVACREDTISRLERYQDLNKTQQERGKDTFKNNFDGFSPPRPPPRLSRAPNHEPATGELSDYSTGLDEQRNFTYSRYGEDSPALLLGLTGGTADERYLQNPFPERVPQKREQAMLLVGHAVPWAVEQSINEQSQAQKDVRTASLAKAGSFVKTGFTEEQLQFCAELDSISRQDARAPLLKSMPSRPAQSVSETPFSHSKKTTDPANTFRMPDIFNLFTSPSTKTDDKGSNSQNPADARSRPRETNHRESLLDLLDPIRMFSANQNETRLV